jgi:hypothetical protein
MRSSLQKLIGEPHAKSGGTAEIDEALISVGAQPSIRKIRRFSRLRYEKKSSRELLEGSASRQRNRWQRLPLSFDNSGDFHPAFSIELLKLHLLNGGVVIGSRGHCDTRKQHGHGHLVKMRRIIQHILPREIVAARFQKRNNGSGNIRRWS